MTVRSFAACFELPSRDSHFAGLRGRWMSPAVKEPGLANADVYSWAREAAFD